MCIRDRVCVNTVISFVVGFEIGNRRGHGKIQGDNNKNVVSEIVLIDGIGRISVASYQSSRLCMNDNLIIS